MGGLFMKGYDLDEKGGLFGLFGVKSVTKLMKKGDGVELRHYNSFDYFKAKVTELSDNSIRIESVSRIPEMNVFPGIARNAYNAIYANLINKKTFNDLETTLNHKSPILEKEYSILENKYKKKLLSFTITVCEGSYNSQLTSGGYYKTEIKIEYRYNLEGQVMTTSNDVNMYLGYNDGKFVYKDAENIIKDFSY
jgi:hypothetical protein